jgi:hypothetical protein
VALSKIVNVWRFRKGFLIDLNDWPYDDEVQVLALASELSKEGGIEPVVNNTVEPDSWARNGLLIICLLKAVERLSEMVMIDAARTAVNIFVLLALGFVKTYSAGKHNIRPLQ